MIDHYLRSWHSPLLKSWFMLDILYDCTKSVTAIHFQINIKPVSVHRVWMIDLRCTCKPCMHTPLSFFHPCLSINVLQDTLTMTEWQALPLCVCGRIWLRGTSSSRGTPCLMETRPGGPPRWSLLLRRASWCCWTASTASTWALWLCFPGQSQSILHLLCLASVYRLTLEHS